MNDYSSSYATGGAFALIFGVLLIPLIILWVIMVVSHWRIFTKAGKPGWAAIIPIYNTIVLIEIVGKPIWWIFLLLIPCVNIIFAVWIINLLSKSFGQSEGFTVGLLLLSFIFYPILAFGNYEYQGPAAAEAKGKWGPPPSPFSPNNYQDPNSPPQV